MVKLLVLLLCIALAVASAAGYFIVEAKMTAGERQMALGEERLRAGRSALAEGKAELEAGEKALSEGKEEYKQASRNPVLLLLDKLLNQDKGFSEGREAIAAGEHDLAEGRSAVSAGERRVEAGAVEISRGREQLRVAGWVRLGLAVGAAVFGVLALVLGVCWRRSLVRMFTRAETG